jgi:hypothetical protein
MGRGGPDRNFHLTALQETGIDMSSTVSPVQLDNDST